MATIKDVARASGVSTTTVSFVLNNTGSVGAEARARVLEAARELGYTANPLARAMITRRTQSLGVLVNNVSTFTTSSMLTGIEEAARRGGYEILLALHRDDPDTATDAIRALSARRVDTIVSVFAKTDERPDVTAALESAGVPYVIAFYRAPHDSPLDTVVADQEQGGFIATQHLLELGRKRIAFFGGSEKRNATRQRLAGFLRAHRAAGVSPNGPFIVFDEFSVEAGHRLTNRLWAMTNTDNPVAPDAIFAADDAIAAGALQALRRLKKQVPKDVAAVGFNDSELCLATDPQLTSVAMPLEEIGRRSVERAILRLEAGADWTPQQFILPCHLARRASA